tara:strand:+ start:129 stop:1316 length:1188 start_codon:yes stop_codon:yes gene_type:complete
MVSDTGVSLHGESLANKRILLAITGGIAAVESVRLSREIRRHGATVHPIMTKEATKVITPLAISWGTGSEVITDWDSSMSQLGNYDAILIAPATRNSIAKHLNGIMDSPVMMALSAARGNGTPRIFVPSMHSDLFDDPVTGDLLESLEKEGSHIILDEEREGKRKQSDPIEIVSRLCHIVNSSLPKRRKIALTLGANSSPIDDIRSIVNTSSGNTGWSISEFLYRMGHEVICIAGNTSLTPGFKLPDVRHRTSPDEMLNEAKQVSKEEVPDVWIFSAAVLDYVPEVITGKIPSGDANISISLLPTKKQIPEILSNMEGCFSIGFKLESNTDYSELIEKAKLQMDRYSLDAVVANRLQDLDDPDTPRCWIVDSNGSTTQIPDLQSLCLKIEEYISD